jgi:hypothetical protein
MCYLRCHQPRQLFRATLNSIKSDIDLNFFLGLGIGIESSTSFCLIIPVQPGNGIDTNYIAATELTGVSACTSSVPVGKYYEIGLMLIYFIGAKPTKQLPDGLIISAHHISNEFYSQVTGRYNPSAYGLSPQDYGMAFLYVQFYLQ